MSGGAKTPILLRQIAVRTSNLPAKDVSTGQMIVVNGERKTRSSNAEMPDAVTQTDNGQFTTLRAVYLGFKPRAKLCTLDYGVASGAWTDAAVYDLQTEKTRVLLPGREVTFSGMTRWGKMMQKWDWTMINTTDDLSGDVARRIVGITASGKTVTLGLMMYGPSKGKTVYVTEFTPAQKPNDIREFRLQTRPYQWAEFRDVHLQPSR